MSEDPHEAVRSGKLREDLYYRLNVFTIFVPPLRDRKADLLLLADHFLAKYAAQMDKAIHTISHEAQELLSAPGASPVLLTRADEAWRERLTPEARDRVEAIQRAELLRLGHAG